MPRKKVTSDITDKVETLSQTGDSEESYSFEFNTNLVNWGNVLFNSSVSLDISPSTVKRWLNDPMLFNKELRDLSRKLYNSNGIYTNTIDYMIALPTLDRVVYSTDKDSSKFKKNKKKFLEALRKLKDKITTRDILLKLAIDGIAFYYFENTEVEDFKTGMLTDDDISKMTEINENFNCSLISLPTNYCKIIGTKNSSYVMAFNLSYFDQFTSNGLSNKLKKYPKEIREKYRKYIKNKSLKWAVLDNNKTLIVKTRSNSDEPWGRPIGLAAMADMLYDEYFVDTKRGLLDDINNTIIFQTFPEGEKKGSCSLTQNQQREQHNNIKGAVFGKGNKKGVSFFSVAAGTKLDTIKTDIELLKTNLQDELIKRISTNLGFTGSALNGLDGSYSSQQTNIELVAAQLHTWIEQIQEEYNKIINLNIIKDKNCFIEVNYQSITFVNRDKMVRHMKELYAIGGGSLIAWIESTGWNPEAYLSLMDYEKEEDFDKKYVPHQTSYTLTNKGNSEKTAGRTEELSPTNENTIKSKTNKNYIRPE